MIALDDARSFVWSAISPNGPTTVTVADSVGSRLATDVVSTIAVPPFDNTAVDGFALRSSDAGEAGARLRIVGTSAAGDPGDLPVGAGEAVRIMTGAPIPPGADCVAMVEVCAVDVDHRDEWVTVAERVEVGAGVRPIGDDVGVGDVVMRAGDLITPGGIGLLCTLGETRVEVVRTPRVALFSTGNELVEPGVHLGPGQIHDSNRAMLAALVTGAGCDVVDFGLIPDDEMAIESALRSACAGCDAVVTSGGVSMGDFDFVKVVLDRIGDMRWMQVAIRPAKPLAFGHVDGTPVFGLPGNPVSSAVSFELFTRPALRAMAGHGFERRLVVSADAVDGFRRRRDGKIHFARVVVGRSEGGGWTAASAGGQGSHQLSALAMADGLAVLPDGDGMAPGGQVDVMLLR